MPLGYGVTDQERILLDILHCLKAQCFNDSSALRVDEDTAGGTVTTYIGYAQAGSLTADPVWAIQKVVEVTVGAAVDTTRTWAISVGNTDYLAYNKIWDDRLALTYA